MVELDLLLLLHRHVVVWGRAARVFFEVGSFALLAVLELKFVQVLDFVFDFEERSLDFGQRLTIVSKLRNYVIKLLALLMVPLNYFLSILLFALVLVAVIARLQVSNEV